MTLKELENTKWASDFRIYCPIDYYTAIGYSSEPNLEVIINHLNINGDMGYAILVAEDEDFWMGCRYNLPDTLQLCNEMGWKIKNE